ncbi:hypothetical protein [Hydrocoleum sp. CS-953]|uniref:hypothetical protein n=1 Tax=Hydrocoleum sp. CS-953 TaxID=1671698 RepID=UPI00143D0BA5|nr:hypothetical protein [Hydrocoleum sp. CS-953]
MLLVSVGFRLDREAERIFYRDLNGARGILIMHRGRKIFYHIGRYSLSRLILLCIVNNC